MLTDINSSKYPYNYDDDSSLVYIQAGETEVSSLHLNQIRSSIFAIERALGVMPGGTTMSVAQRLSQLGTDVDSLFRGTFNHSVTFGYDSEGYAARAAFGTSCETYIVYDGNRKRLSLTEWPSTGLPFDLRICEYNEDVPPGEIVPLSIVGSDAGGIHHRRIRMFDDVEVTNSMSAVDIYGNWGLMKLDRYLLDGSCVVTTDATYPLNGWTIMEYAQAEITRLGGELFVNESGDCMNGDLVMSFYGDIPDEYTGPYGYTDFSYGYDYGYDDYGMDASWSRPAALVFGNCLKDDNGNVDITLTQHIYPFIVFDKYANRIRGNNNDFTPFVHEGDVVAHTRPLLIYGNTATTSNDTAKRRIKMVDDVEVVGSVRVNQYVYAGDNDVMTIKPDFTSTAKTYNGFLTNPSQSYFSVADASYSSGFVGAGVTYGHRPGHTHTAADVLDFAANLIGPQIVAVQDTFDNYRAANPYRDGFGGRAVGVPSTTMVLNYDGPLVSRTSYWKNITLIVENMFTYDEDDAPKPILQLRGRINSTSPAPIEAKSVVINGNQQIVFFDLDEGFGSFSPANVPVLDQYDITLTAPNGLVGHSLLSRSGGIKVLDPLVLTLDFPVYAQTETPATFSVSVTGEATTTGGEPPYTYVWDFGDSTPILQEDEPDNATSTTTFSPTATHTYHSSGTVTVSITVLDVNGFTVASSSAVPVYGACVVPTIGATIV